MPTSSAQQYKGLVVLEEVNGKLATFTTYGIADKKKDAEQNALQSLFHTLFYTGVDGLYDGKPLLAKDNAAYVNNFLDNKCGIYSYNRQIIRKPTKNSQKKFETTLLVTVPIENLLKELTQNGLCGVEVESVASEVLSKEELKKATLPTIMVVPYKKSGESYEAILQSDYDRRVAVAKLQSAFQERGITTIDISAKIAAMKRRSEYEYDMADSNDKQMLLSSGAEVYVVVDLLKDIQSSGSRVSLVMKAYETASGSVLASQDGFTRRYPTSAVDVLCSYAVEDYADKLLDDIVEKLSEQVTSQKRVVLQFSISSYSMTTMFDQVGSSQDKLSDLLRNWVRNNSDNGQYHLQGVVAESMIFDYVMIPAVAKDGMAMDPAQFEYELRNYLENQGISCSSKLDGSTIYITIE